MRKRLTIDDDVLLAAEALAAEREVSLGQVVSDLLRRVLHQGVSFHMRNGLPVFDVPEDAPRISLEAVMRAEDEPW